MSDAFHSLLTVVVDAGADCTFVVPSGELDMACSGRIEAEVLALLETGCAEIVLDLRGLDFIDSTGVRELLRCRDAARERGVPLALQLAPGAVSRALEICGVRDGFSERRLRGSGAGEGR